MLNLLLPPRILEKSLSWISGSFSLKLTNFGRHMLFHGSQLLDKFSPFKCTFIPFVSSSMFMCLVCTRSRDQSGKLSPVSVIVHLAVVKLQIGKFKIQMSSGLSRFPQLEKNISVHIIHRDHLTCYEGQGMRLVTTKGILSFTLYPDIFIKMILVAQDCCNIFQTSGTDCQQLCITEFKLLYNAQQFRVQRSLMLQKCFDGI